MLIALGIPCFVLGQELYNNDVDSAEYHYAIATELLEADLLDSATYHLTKSLAYGKENSDWDIINLALSDLGYLSFLTEEYEKSLQCFDAAINNALAHTPQDTLFIEDNYYYAGAVANDIQDYDQALHYLNNSLNISIKKNNQSSQTNTFLGIGIIYRNKSDYDNALNYLYQALDKELYSSNSNKVILCDIYNQISLSWYFKQEYDKAFYYSSLAQETLEGIKEEQRGELANIYNTHALVSIKKNKYRKAEVYLNKALALVDRFQYPRDKNELMFNKAFLSYSQGNYDAAKAGFEKTSSYLKEKYPEDHKLIGKAQYYLGHINYNKKKYLDALEYCEASLRSFIPEYSDTLFQSTSTLYCRSLRNAARTLVLKAKVEYRIVQKMSSASTDKLKEVFQTYDTALKLFDLLRKQYHAEDSKHFLATETRELFSSVFDMCYELVSGGNSEYISQAFHFIEKAQSPILFDRADLSDITDKGGVNINLFKKESELLINDSYYKNQLAKAKSEQDSFKIKMFSNYKSRNKKALDSLKVVLKENHPNYFNYQYASRHVTLEEFQLAMPDDLGWLQYHIEEDKIYVLYITATETYFDKIVIDDKLRDHLRSFIQIFNPEEQVDLSYEKASVEEYVTPAAYIYEVLVGSYISFDKPRLALCPSGILNYIPFDGLLTTTDRDVDNFIDLPYLIEEVAINYQNSANLFYRNIHHKNTESREDMIAFAPFADIDTIYSILRADDRLALQHSKTEVENLMQLFDGRSYFGKEATKGVFIENVNACQVLHLATHGSANDTIPANAYLMFSDPKDTIQDSNLLHAYEIQNLDLKADLVVLSACDTGHGTIDEGEGPMSLARAFVYAGIPSTVMSKWKVNDLSGSKIVSAFYHQLTKGARKDIALQNAKKHYLSEEADFITAHPYYWAALSQIGNTSSLSNKSHLFGGQTTYVAFGCALFLLVGSVLFRFIKKS